MIRAAILIPSVTFLAAADATSSGILDPVTRLSATGVLGFVVVWMAVKAAPQFRDAVLMLVKRIDQWEESRHEDSERLAESLDALRQHCRRAQVDGD